MRYAMGIEYDGSAFLGWQSQKQTPTVQDTVQAALSRVADAPIKVFCAGRTDTGVHALCQVIHFDSPSERSGRSWILGANSNLPETVGVMWAQPVDEEFHARFSAIARSYRYNILNRWTRPVVESGKVSWCRKPLDADAMNAAASALVGKHDFSSFRSSGCKANHAVRDLRQISVERQGDRVVLDISANGFLYHMVRNIAGSLMDVGKGTRPVSWIGELLDQRDRKLAGVTASPDGLYFMGVRYPDQFEIPVTLKAFPAVSGLS